VVGRNGSGKSNLFDAVQFVLLAPRFYTLRTEERQALLHEGSGTTAVSAFVEIVFDNSDNRFSLENSDEVVLRRTIGHKKDEFFLQRKRATKNEIMSLLEGAGFSKSNPYYIVQQGKVNALCTMNDAERLRLLKEVAGTTVYDEKKAESLSKMEENKSSIDKIENVLETIETRLDELRGEKEELTHYQSLDRERRAMEYTLYDMELQKARHTLDSIEGVRTTGTEGLSELHEAARQTHDGIRSTETQMRTKSNALRRNRLQWKDSEADQLKAISQRTKLELECKELQESVKFGAETQKQNAIELKKLAVEIAAAETDLDQDIQPKYDTAMQSLEQLTNERDEAQKKVDGLYAKQGRGRKFASREDRDAYLASHIAELDGQKSEKEASLAEHQDLLSSLRRAMDTDHKNLERLKGSIDKKSTTLQTFHKAIDEKKRERLELHDKRKDQWRNSEELREKVKEARDHLHQSQSNVRKVMPRATSMGLEALRNVVQQEGLVEGEQYFGMLMDNFELTDVKYQTAIEVSAQNSLFHVIVDTDGTAAKLMKRLEKDRLGRVTFLPLNRLRIDRANYPDSPDVRPLLGHCIKYDPKVDRAMKHVFGKKLLARNVDVASTWSARCKMDAITLEGDLVSRKGALSGGFVDLTRSRLRAQAQSIEAREALRKAEMDHRDVKQKAEAVDQSATNIMGELQRLEAKHADLNHMLTESDGEVKTLQIKMDHHKKQMVQVEKTTIPSLERDTASVTAEIGRLQDEMATELAAALSEDERSMLKRFKTIQSDLTAEIETQSETVSQLTVERQRLQSLLTDNLLKRRQELLEDHTAAEEDELNRRASRGKTSSAAVQEQRRDDLAIRQRELDDASRVADEIDVRLEDVRQADATLKAEMIEAKNKFEHLKSLDMKNSEALEAAQQKAEKLLNKRSMTVSKRELYMRKIQELGSLPPPSELANFNDLSISALMRDLDKVNKKLKKYSHVNKKAYDQFLNFSEQRESLLKRKEELDKGAEKVKELIESLDRQKDEAINRTFRGVSVHFKEVFKELLPNGSGQLIMKTALDEADETDDEAESDLSQDGEEKEEKASGNPDVSLYRGIGIKVRFSNVGENYLMSQLSGGQKALVAMALIFAIQRCDPAPFYLFDELDQALDSTHRKSVANLIERQANSAENPTQFIVSTFRPELVAIANRCYGISHQNKVSSIHHLSKKDALHFVANLMKDEEALGEVSTVAPSRGTSRGGSLLSRKRKTIAAVDEEGGASSDDGSAQGESMAAEEEPMSPA